MLSSALGGSMIYTLAKVHDNVKTPLACPLNEGEIALSKKAARAFAIGYVNEIYNTIKKVDPSSLNNLCIIHKYPFYLHIFIHQDEPGSIDKLDIYFEHKNNDDGLSEVKEIHHSAEHDPNSIRKRKRTLAKTCNHWRWTSLEIPRMYTMAISEGKKVGMSIYNRYVLSFEWLFPKSFVHQPGLNLPDSKTNIFESQRPFNLPKP
jgi:hypothetical protein